MAMYPGHHSVGLGVGGIYCLSLWLDQFFTHAALDIAGRICAGQPSDVLQRVVLGAA